MTADQENRNRQIYGLMIVPSNVRLFLVFTARAPSFIGAQTEREPITI